jgi:ATP-dependent Clp protease ATP-binding subunit ClpX
MLEATEEGKLCSFCGKKCSPGDRLMGGLGAFICHPCARRAVAVMDALERETPAEPPWARMRQEELLAVLPDIVATSDQVDDFLHDWVGMLRERGASWQKIGLALGVSRQAAWERFTRVKRALTDGAQRG